MYLQKKTIFYSLPYLTLPILTLTDNQSKKSYTALWYLKSTIKSNVTSVID